MEDMPHPLVLLRVAILGGLVLGTAVGRRANSAELVTHYTREQATAICVEYVERRIEEKRLAGIALPIEETRYRVLAYKACISVLQNPRKYQYTATA